MVSPVYQTNTFATRLIFFCSVLFALSFQNTQGRTIHIHNGTERQLRRTHELDTKDRPSKSENQTVKDLWKEWKFPIELNSENDGEGTVLSDILATIETFLQQEESRLLTDIQEFHETLKSQLGLQNRKQQRIKRDINGVNSQTEVDVSTNDQVINEKNGKIKSSYDINKSSSNDNLTEMQNQNGVKRVAEDESQRPLGDFRRKFAMKLMKDDTGRTTLHFDYDYETLERTGRSKREASDPSTDTLIVFVALLAVMLTIFGVIGLAYLSSYLCKKYKVCKRCYRQNDGAMRDKDGEVIPSFTVTNARGYRRFLNLLPRGFGPATIPTSTKDYLGKNPQAGMRTARSHPNLPLLRDKGIKGEMTPKREGRTKRQRQRSLSESDCKDLQEKTNRQILLRKTQRKYRNYLARVRAQRTWSKRYNTSRGAEHDSGDSGFSTPTTSTSNSSNWNRSHSRCLLNDSYHHHLKNHHGVDPPPVHSLQHYSLNRQFGRSVSSLTSSVSRVTSDVGSDVTIPGLIDY